jgi:hypothetical protein
VDHYHGRSRSGAKSVSWLLEKKIPRKTANIVVSNVGAPLRF